MIQFYDDRPGDPIEAFFYFDQIFGGPLSIGGSLSSEDMFRYVERLLIAVKELELPVLTQWSVPMVDQFTPELYFRFRRDVVSLFPQLWDIITAQRIGGILAQAHHEPR